MRCSLAAQVGAGLRPDGFTRNRRIDGHVELPAAWMGPKVGCLNPKRQTFVGAEWALLRDAVGDMNEARQGKRKRRIDHQRHSQREGEHMRVGERQHIRMPEAADLRDGQISFS